MKSKATIIPLVFGISLTAYILTVSIWSNIMEYAGKEYMKIYQCKEVDMQRESLEIYKETYKLYLCKT